MCDILRYARADWKALISSRGRLPVIVPLWPPSRLSEMWPSLTPVRAFFSANRNPVILECQPLLASPLTPRMIPCVCVCVFFFSPLLLEQHSKEHSVHSTDTATVSQSANPSQWLRSCLCGVPIHLRLQVCRRKWHIWNMQQLRRISLQIPKSFGRPSKTKTVFCFLFFYCQFGAQDM